MDYIKYGIPWLKDYFYVWRLRKKAKKSNIIIQMQPFKDYVYEAKLYDQLLKVYPPKKRN